LIPAYRLGVTTLQMIGGGKMGQALLAGMVANGWASPGDLAVVDPDQSQRRAAASAAPGVAAFAEPLEGVRAVLAVKPHLVVEVAATLVSPPLVISIAAGITTSTIEAVLPPNSPVIRVMTNTPAQVGLGASAVAAGSAASEGDLAWTRDMFEAVGTTVVVSESQLDAVTGLSGSGPAYIFLLAEAMADAGVAAGLARPVAEMLANQTLHGAGAMLTQTGVPAAQLRASVTTPAGTTAAGLAVLESRAVRSAMIEAVKAAASRSEELGRG